MKKKGLIYGILVVLVLSVGVSYAYFTGVITGEGKRITVSAKELKIVFTDTSEIVDTEITPGWKTSKTFSVKNESGRPFNYNIVLNDLINTFKTDGNLQYKITSTNGYNMEDFKDIPKSETKTDVVLEYDVDIDTDVTHEYTIYFRYKNSEEDQSIDMGETFGGTIGIKEGTINPNVFYSVTLNVTNGEVTDKNPKETLKKGVVEFNVTPTEGYNLGNNVTCDNEAVGTIENNKVTISNVTANTICTLNSDIKIYNVGIVVNNGTSEELNRLVEHNSSGTFTISPNTGYTLDGASITGDGCTIENNVVTASNVTSDRTCEVTLVKEKYNVYLTGNITTESPKLVEYLGETTFNITPQEGYEIESTNINCNNGATASREGNIVTVSNITTETTCTISTQQLEYEVTLNVVNGTGSTRQTITHGSSGTFSIGANTGYNLTNPDITCTGSATPSINGSNVTISNVKGVQTCTITLQPNEYNLQVTSNNNTYGTVSPTSGKITHGSNVEITLTPASGFEYSNNTCGAEPVNGKIKLRVSGNINCQIAFEPIKYLVSVNVTGGSASDNGSKYVNYNESTTFTITANSGYTLEGATVSGTGCSLKNSLLSINEVKSDIVCNIVLLEAFMINISATNGRNVNIVKPKGTTMTIYAHPDEGYGVACETPIISQVSGSHCVFDENYNLQVTNLNQNLICFIEYKACTATICLNTINNGKLTSGSRCQTKTGNGTDLFKWVVTCNNDEKLNGASIKNANGDYESMWKSCSSGICTITLNSVPDTSSKSWSGTATCKG